MGDRLRYLVEEIRTDRRRGGEKESVMRWGEGRSRRGLDRDQGKRSWRHIGDHRGQW